MFYNKSEAINVARVGGRNFFHVPPAPSYFKCLLTRRRRKYKETRSCRESPSVYRPTCSSVGTFLLSMKRGRRYQRNRKTKFGKSHVIGFAFFFFYCESEAKDKFLSIYIARRDPSRRPPLIIYNAYQSSKSDLNIYKLMMKCSHTKRKLWTAYHFQFHNDTTSPARRVSRTGEPS